jgi:hypothetical protein
MILHYILLMGQQHVHSFSVFTSGSTTLLASIEDSVFFFMVSIYHPVDSHQHRPPADVSVWYCIKVIGVEFSLML